MTVVDFRNVDFTTKADQIFDEKMRKKNKKITKIWNEIMLGNVQMNPMPKKDLIDIIHMVYTEKSEEILKKVSDVDGSPGGAAAASN